jgi:hypothetical protein
MQYVLITGSRDASFDMLVKAVEVVIALGKKGDAVIVGDAEGIDEQVIRACESNKVPVYVFGAYNRMRHQTRWIAHNLMTPGSYIERDKLMATFCTGCIGIWNGRSRGCKATMDFARALGKPVELFNFGGQS